MTTTMMIMLNCDAKKDGWLVIMGDNAGTIFDLLNDDP